MKRVPYGESNYKKVMDNNLYYIDKTKYIEILEMMPSYQFFIRPRRFGKSLFLSMLETYYDVNEKEKFEHYFKDKYIGKNKTDEANEYLILRLSFAGIVTDRGIDEIISGFEKTVRFAVEEFLYNYKSLIIKSQEDIISFSAIELLKFIIKEIKKSRKKLFLLIDEYDNFANGLMIKDKEMYKALVQTDGYIKSFYKEIKEGTAEGVIFRVFITGVSPILIDDLTSGANIFKNISNEYILNSMMGVTQDELEELVEYYNLDKYVEKNELYSTLKVLYDGYKFNEEVEQAIYNTGMIMYIADCMNLNKKYPKNMLDDNIKTDYGKIRNLAKNFESRDELRRIIENNELIKDIKIKSRFGIDRLFDKLDKDESFFSLLYYLGMLTIVDAKENTVSLGIPNYSVKTMYWEYLYNYYEVSNLKNLRTIRSAVRKMRKEADINDIMEVYTQIRKGLSNRDLINYNEMTSKGIFVTLVYADGIYIMESEKEHREGYSDLYLTDGITYKDEVKYRYLIEFKHIKTEHTKEEFEQKKQDAKDQLTKYIKDYKLKEDSEKLLKKMIIITIGKNDTYYEELN